MQNLIEDYHNPISSERLQKLHDVVRQGPVAILTHDNPDPDALASGATLATLFSEVWEIPTRLGYSGLVARAENKAMLEILTPQWEPLENLGELRDFPTMVLVDTQPEAGNNSLPSDLIPQAVFDHHHPIRNGMEKIPFQDVRTEMGATTSVAFQYLDASGYEPDAQLSTAIFYGIQADTQGLSRGGSLADQEIYFRLLSRIDRQKLTKVVQAGLPREYFQAFSDGLQATRIFGSVLVSYLGMMHRPDFVAEMADALIRLEGARAVLCMGYHGDILYLSLRTPPIEDDAGLMIQRIITPNGKAGGHGTMGGGQVRITGQSPDELAAEVQHKFLEVMQESGEGENLLS
jgi:nanoRNase/pAp phosphatase (c-di-AMP/oligoRNAs hydrolase)